MLNYYWVAIFQLAYNIPSPSTTLISKYTCIVCSSFELISTSKVFSKCVFIPWWIRWSGEIRNLWLYVDGLVQDGSNSIAKALETPSHSLWRRCRGTIGTTTRAIKSTEHGVVISWTALEHGILYHVSRVKIKSPTLSLCSRRCPY